MKRILSWLLSGQAKAYGAGAGGGEKQCGDDDRADDEEQRPDRSAPL